ncbi:hypothetical protein QTG54_010967 [Skeletonema marinoi]|uniref:Uncharacterized protein n=1 Tax=Skeletonema marinoi TaxID=267567 RepID=A0AAD9DA20_9STRA|nr:hypothetical protein QTG54_010967 [Skeletonema marinoi]|eukprot:CAMPEP_0113413314 /NCGR_PEP_ID=MMETSP0013_2-20120614/23356_1 /TAXON_ID=2843 ORGANISM="Skeletonema costatum, Strain 1716" /NCGR_SAMPLE_ID=MMETSP0013_2 /ASSEMBLY_ACC=CAM_ASM_000158 /LENGTH=93 /DNA_ID=CAMNT_0000299973 /DNA_START=33 /DNA_END=314 /DNA_ORIENTATION=- /assembly_acc=CAM_ASM_000158
MTFIQDLLKPGGGIALIPFIRGTIATLLVLVILMGIADIARIHMVVLASLSIGLLMSISWFEKAWNDVQSSRGESSSSSAAVNTAGKEPEKTD